MKYAIEKETNSITVFPQGDIPEQYYTEITEDEYNNYRFEQAKQDKLQEALNKANDFINNEVTYKDIECTSDNISKLTAYLIAMQQGLYEEITWVTKSDEVVTLTIEDVMDILQNIGIIQTDIWSNQYINYKRLITKAKTIKGLEAIEIEYKYNS